MPAASSITRIGETALIVCLALSAVILSIRFYRLTRAMRNSAESRRKNALQLVGVAGILLMALGALIVLAFSVSESKLPAPLVPLALVASLVGTAAFLTALFTGHIGKR